MKLFRKGTLWTSGTGGPVPEGGGEAPYWGGGAGGAAGGVHPPLPPLRLRPRFGGGPPTAGGPAPVPTSAELAEGRPQPPLFGLVFPDPLGSRYLSATRFGGSRTTGLRGFGPTLFIHRCGFCGVGRGSSALRPGPHPTAAQGRRWSTGALLASPFVHW